jgi:RNA-dependent RNA polymerase
LRSIRLQDLGLPDLQEPSSDLEQEMAYILHQYTEQLSVIANTHTLSRNPNHHLTEAELVTGTIEAIWDNHRGRQEAAAAMNLQVSQIEVCMFIRHSRSMSQTQELVWAVRRELLKMNQDVVDMDDEDEGDDDEGDHERSHRIAETMTRSWAAWLVAEAELQENPDAFGPQSFGLIALGSLLKIIKEATIA